MKDVTLNYSKLKGRIVEKYGSQKAFAEALGVSRASVCSVLSSKKFLHQKKIVAWCEALEIGIDDVGKYFFCKESSQNSKP